MDLQSEAVARDLAHVVDAIGVEIRREIIVTKLLAADRNRFFVGLDFCLRTVGERDHRIEKPAVVAVEGRAAYVARGIEHWFPRRRHRMDVDVSVDMYVT